MLKEEGPIVREYARPKRKVCDQCKWCHASKIFGHKSVDILMADCTHPDAKKQLGGNALDFDNDCIFTPDWCPVEKQP